VALADPIRFRQIVRNLVTNAIRYGGDEIQISMSRKGDRVAVCVADDGPGVPEEDRERIFEAYHRAHSSAGQPGSVGLGLTVSRTLAELMGGSLSYSKNGLSTFVLDLPMATSAGTASDIRFEGAEASRQADGRAGAALPGLLDSWSG